MSRTHHIRRCLLRAWAVAAIASAVLAVSSGSSAGAVSAVRTWVVHYTAHNGAARAAYVLLPSWYGPSRNPALPIVISPHGRGTDGRSNARFWGELPAIGQFAVVNPDGMGRRLERLSYGYEGQIDDLATMPDVVSEALPWLRIDRSQVYALGSSMGGQETLLLVARHGRLLAGAAAMDSVTDLARRYGQLPDIPCDPGCLDRWGKPYGLAVQDALRREVGGTPDRSSAAYAQRSALAQAQNLARSGVPLQIWWSSRDQIVFDQEHQSGALVRALRRLDARAPILSYMGTWRHSQAMWAGSLLPIALAGFGLLPDGYPGFPGMGRSERGACVSTAGLSGIPRIIAADLRCRSTT